VRAPYLSIPNTRVLAYALCATCLRPKAREMHWTYRQKPAAYRARTKARLVKPVAVQKLMSLVNKLMVSEVTQLDRALKPQIQRHLVGINECDVLVKECDVLIQ
jgi:hypothetical protein